MTNNLDVLPPDNTLVYSYTLSSMWASVIFVLLTLLQSIYLFFDPEIILRQRLLLAFFVGLYILFGTYVWRRLQRQYRSSHATRSYFLVQTVTGLLLFSNMVMSDGDSFAPLYAIPLFLQSGVLPLKQRWWILAVTLVGVAGLNTYGLLLHEGFFSAWFVPDALVDVTLLVSFGVIGHYLIHEESLRHRVEGLVNEIERRRRSEQSRFEHLDKMRTEFVNSATHDLKNPLGIIMGYASLLVDDLDESRPEYTYAREILTSSQRMQDLILEMLDLAQIETGLELKPETVLLSEFLQRAVENNRMAAEQKSIELILPKNVGGLKVRFDPRYMERVLDNLLSNAIKFTPENGTVMVQARLGGAQVMISVKDTGPGISEDERSRVFEPFFRTKAEKLALVPGTGLGLSIVKSIVEQHEGTVQVESTLRQGTTFTIILPQHTPQISAT